MVRGYVLIEVTPHQADTVVGRLKNLLGGAADAIEKVTGQYDVIVQMKAQDLDSFVNLAIEVHGVEDVFHATTCLAIRL